MRNGRSIIHPVKIKHYQSGIIQTLTIVQRVPDAPRLIRAQTERNTPKRGFIYLFRGGSRKRGIKLPYSRDS